MPTSQEPGTNRHQGFPGGRPRLPRLSGEPLPERPRSEHPRPDAGSRSEPNPGRRSTDPRAEEQQVEGSFTDYFTVESLFAPTPEIEEETVGSKAYAVLGLTHRASWKEITRAHRDLVSMLHPDRYVDADEETREAAERRVRDVNEAFSQIRRERSPSHA